MSEYYGVEGKAADFYMRADTRYNHVIDRTFLKLKPFSEGIGKMDILPS